VEAHTGWFPFGQGTWSVEVWRDSDLSDYYKVGKTRSRNFYHYNNVPNTHRERLSIFEYKKGARKVGWDATRNLTIFYEMTKDYRIDIRSYFFDTLALPYPISGFGIYYRTDENRIKLLDHINEYFDEIEWDFLELENGVLTMKKGYRWDGTSRPKTEDVGVKDVRASGIHDALYDLMRLRLLDPQTEVASWDDNGYKNRLIADIMWYMLSKEDGRTTEHAHTNFEGLRIGGRFGTENRDKLLPWKFHAAALTAWGDDGKVHLHYQPADLGKMDPKAYSSIDRRYEIFRSTAGASDWTHVGSSVAPKTLSPSHDPESIFFTDNSGLQNDRIYYYWIRSNVYDSDTDKDGWTNFEEDKYGGDRNKFSKHPYFKEKHYDESGVEAAVPVAGTGNALRLNGVDQFVISTEEPGNLGHASWTFEAWVYPETDDAESTILAVSTFAPEYPGNYRALMHDGINHRFCFDDGYGTRACNDSTPIFAGHWYHLAVTVDGGQGRMYVNGEIEGEFQPSVVPLLEPSFSIGASFDLGKRFQSSEMEFRNHTLVPGGWLYEVDPIDHFQGRIDELRIWTKVLTQTEIVEEMYQPMRGDDPALAALWHFDEPDDTNTAFDDTANGRDAAVYNCTYRVECPTPSHCYVAEDYDCFVASDAMNRPPVADAGGPYLAECTGPDGAEMVFDGSGSYDPEGGPLEYHWLVNGVGATGVSPRYLLPLGEHEVDLAVVDETGREGSDETSATVFDATPPVITGISEPISVWPPKHAWATFDISSFVFSFTDTCDELSLDELQIVRVTSNESAGDTGSGKKAEDFIIAPDGKSVDLLTERRGKGDGRVYTVDINGSDASGNETAESFEVEIRHDQRKK
jgi:hypothetical protein